MDNVNEAVALLRRQAELQLHFVNRPGTAVATEWEMEELWRRLALRPQLVNAVLQTARALQLTPDAIAAREVEAWNPTISS